MARVLPISLAQLSQDHLEMRAVLNALRRHVDAVTQGTAPDPVLLSDTLHFLDSYPRRMHHIVEGMICEALVARARHRAGEIVASDHGESNDLIATFALAVRNILLDTQHFRGAFCRAAQNLIAYKRDHMRREEIFLFQYALDFLNGDDWTAIDQFVAEHAPPATPERRIA